MPFSSHKEANDDLRARILKGIGEHFPIKGKNKELHLEGLEADMKEAPTDIRKQHEHKVKGRTFSTPVYATIRLDDKKTGKSKTEKVRIASIPVVTQRYSHIIDGKEYQVDNQWQLKPGAYTRRGAKGQLHTAFNAPDGRDFQVELDPASKQFVMKRRKSNVPLYPLLKEMGVSDEKLQRAWGKEVLEVNKKARGAAGALEAFYKADTKGTAVSKEEAAEHFKKTMAATKMRPEVAKATLGVESANVTGDILFRSTKRILAVQAGGKEDDRDSLEFKNLRSVGDYAYEKLTHWKAKKAVQGRARRKLDKSNSIRDMVKFDSFNEPIRQVFRTSMARMADQINPVEIISSAAQTTPLGPGGIQSVQKVTEGAKAVNPTHLGYLDPLRTPEGEKTGITLRLPMGVRKKGEEPVVALYNTKTKKMEQVPPSKFVRSNVALADQVRWDGSTPKAVDKEITIAGKGNKLMKGTLKDADYIQRHPSQMMNTTTNLVPFLGSCSGNRATYAGQHIEQAISLEHREAPLVQVGTGSKKEGLQTFEDILGRSSGHVAPVDGKVVAVNKDGIIVKDKKGRKHEVQLYNNFPLNDAKAVMHSTPTVKVGDEVKQRQSIADTNFTKDSRLALGTNLRVAYLPYKGYNFEDGVVISSTAAKKLSSVHMQKLPIKLEDQIITAPRKFKVQHPEAFDKEQHGKLDKRGVVQVGQTVKPGDPLVLAMRPYNMKDRMDLGAIRKSLAGNHTDVSLRWDSDHQGKVVGVHRKGKEVSVHIKTIEPMRAGDKLTGRHGNKGIVVSVLDDKEMPHTKDGRPIEVALNPTSVPGRMNPSQILETAAGKVAEKTGKPFIVENFAPKTDNLKMVKDALKKHGLSDTEELIDPVTKQSLGKVLVGPQHMLKLTHQIDKKTAVRSGMPLKGDNEPESYDNNLLPIGGKKTGGQRMSPLGIYSLLAHGAKANIREMQTQKSEGDDPRPFGWPGQHREVWQAIQAGTPLPTPRPTFSFNKFTSLLKAAGVNVEKKGHNIQLLPLTDKQIKGMSSGALPKPSELTYTNLDKNGEPKPKTGGLFDPKITGGHGGKKWAHMRLAEPLPNPVFEGAIQKLTGLKSKDYVALVEGDKAMDEKGNIVELDKPGAVTGGAAIKQLLKGIDVNKELAKQEEQLKSMVIPKGFAHGVPTQKMDDAVKKVKYLRALKEAGMKPAEAYVLENLPVIPPQMRPASVLQDGAVKWDDLNGLYQMFAQVNEGLRKPSTKNLMDSDSAKRSARKELYDGVKAIMGVGSFAEDDKFRGVLRQIHGSSPKEGYFQKTMMNRRQDLSMRSVIVPEPSLGLDEVGLPKDKALKLFRPFLTKKLVELGAAKNTLEAREMLQSKKAPKNPSVMRAMELVAEERPVILKRDPVLHKHSVQAFKTKIVGGKAIRIHPLVTGGFSADFDGDSVHGNILVEVPFKVGYKTCEEAGMPHKSKVAMSIRCMEIADFPRVEESARSTKKGIAYDVPAGIKVPAYCNGSIKMMPVTEFSIHPECVEFLVKTRKGRAVHCSADHSLAVLNMETLEVVKAKPAGSKGMFIPVMRKLEDAKGCPVGLPIPARRKRGGIAANATADTLPTDRDGGWFLGAFIGDGWVSSSNKGAPRQVCLSFGEGGGEVAVRWRKLASRWAEGSIGLITNDHEFEGKVYTSHRLQLSNARLGQFLLQLIPSGARNKMLPAGFLAFPEEYRWGLLCGLLDTDGTAGWSNSKGKKPQFHASYTTVSSMLAEEVQLLGMSLGLPSGCTEYEHRGAPAFIITFSTRPVLDAVDKLQLTHPKKAAALDRLREQTINYGRGDVVPLPSDVKKELLGKFRELGAARKGENKNKEAFASYVTLSKSTGGITRESVEKLAAKISVSALSDKGRRWFKLVSNPGLSWDVIEEAAPTGEVITMYDLTVPEAWTFTMANGLVVWDTMSAYVPIGREAVEEAKQMMPSNNLYAESSGKVTYQPNLDSALGLYKMSRVDKVSKKRFKNPADALKAAQAGKLGMTEQATVGGVKTTPGRMLLASALPREMQKDAISSFPELDKKGLNKLYTKLAKEHKGGFGDTAHQLMRMGYEASHGVVAVPHPEHKGKNAITVGERPDKHKMFIPMGAHSLSLDDLEPDRATRDKHLKVAQKRVDLIKANKRIKGKEEDRQVALAWGNASVAMDKEHQGSLAKNKGRSNLSTMLASGTKPGWDQYKQLKLAPVMMVDSAGDPVPVPVDKSYAEGLDLGGYWTASTGARRGSVRKVQEVSEPGYFSKKLVQNTINLVVTGDDCKTDRGVSMSVGEEGVYDRTLAKPFQAKGLKVPAGTIMTPDVVGRMRKADKKAQLVVRSALKCTHGQGLCQKCAGMGADGERYPVGTNVGILAAQSLGERSVQLPMKEFHSGGVWTPKTNVADQFERVKQLTSLPESIPNSSTLAMVSGRVEKVETDKTGAKVWVGGQAHHVGKDKKGNALHVAGAGSRWRPPKVGDKVTAGMQLSDPGRTVINPRDLYKATNNFEVVQNHLVDELHSIYSQEGVRRQHVETVVKGMTNTTRVRDAGDAPNVLKGELYPTSVVRENNMKLVKAGKRPTRHSPMLKGVDVAPLGAQQDWMARLQHERLRDTIMGAAATGAVSHLHGVHPVPGIAYGALFGLTKEDAKRTPGLKGHEDVPGYYY